MAWKNCTPWFVNHRRNAKQFNDIKTDPASVPKKTKFSKRKKELQEILDAWCVWQSNVRVNIDNEWKVYHFIEDRPNGCVSYSP